MKIVKFLEITTGQNKKNCEQMIKNQRVKINNVVISKINTTIKELKDEIFLDNQLLEYEEYLYLMMNKRAGYVCATTDNFQKTIFEDLHEYQNRDLRIVGRLDKDTEGLLLITNDGALIHHLTSPKHNIDKTYYVEFTGKYCENIEEKFLSGITLDDGYKCLPAIIKKLDEKSCEITIQEGKFHQIKRMCADCGMQVTYLKRLAIGDVKLDETLKIGKYRKLTKEEINQLEG